MGSLSPLEAMRAVVIAIGLWSAAWSYGRAGDGAMAFAMAIRDRMINRRREQMKTYLRVFIALAIGVVSAGLTENVYPITPAVLIGNLTLLYVGVELVVLTFHQSLGWIEFERIVGKTPLTPSPEDVVAQTSIEARDLFHEMHNKMALAIGKVDEIRMYHMMPPIALVTLEEIQQTLLDISVLQNDAHILIRSQSSTSDPVPPKPIDRPMNTGG